jgi:hypothetical protein
MCSDPGPYCASCEECKSCKAFYPGNWYCGESEHFLTREGFKAMCVTCEEFRYCAKCVVQCPCGQGEPHYLCKERFDESHECMCGVKKGCPTRVCQKYCGFEDIRGNGGIVLCCPKHKIHVSKRLKTEVLSRE